MPSDLLVLTGSQRTGRGAAQLLPMPLSLEVDVVLSGEERAQA